MTKKSYKRKTPVATAEMPSINSALNPIIQVASDSKSISQQLTQKGKNNVITKYASAFVSNQTPDYYNPLLQEASLMLPSKLREINQYCRFWYLTDPLVSAATNFHSEFSINGFNNVCKDKKIKEFYDEMAFDILDLPNFLSFVALEWYKIGNIFPMGTWDEDKGMWANLITLNPDYVEIEKTLFSDKPLLKLDPDGELKRIVENKRPKHLYDQLDPEIIKYVAKGQKIPLSDLEIEILNSDGKKGKEIAFPQVCHLARKASQYEVYGTSPIKAAMKILIYKDLLRQAQMAIAKRHWKPIKLIKVGDETHEPNDQILTDLETALAAADGSSNSWLIWHHYISVDYIASAGRTMPLDGEYKYIDLELMRALEISDAVLTNQGMTFANASVSLKVMVNKYLRFQKILSRFIKEFIYKPVAQVQGFYEVDKDNGKEKLIIPDIEWELNRLQEDAQLKSLLQTLQKSGLVSKQTLMAHIGIDYEKEREIIKKERDEEKIFRLDDISLQSKNKPAPGVGDQMNLFEKGTPAGGGGGPAPAITPGVPGKEPGAGTATTPPAVELPPVV